MKSCVTSAPNINSGPDSKFGNATLNLGIKLIRMKMFRIQSQVQVKTKHLYCYIIFTNYTINNNNINKTIT